MARPRTTYAFAKRVPAADKLHRVEQMLRLADVLGVQRMPELVGPAAAPNSQIVNGSDFALIHATPMFAYKEWTPEGWRTLAAGLAKHGLPVVAIGGPGEAERRYLDDVWNGVATAHQVEWPEMKCILLEQARVYIGPDIGLASCRGGQFAARSLFG